MPWSTLVAEEVLQEFTSGERAAVESAQGAVTIDNITSRVVAQVRGACVAGGNAVADGDTLPDYLKPFAIDIIRWRFLVSLPKLAQLQTEERKKMAEAASAALERVAAGEIRIESPSVSGSVQGDDSQIVVTPTQHVTRTTLNGL